MYNPVGSGGHQRWLNRPFFLAPDHWNPGLQYRLFPLKDEAASTMKMRMQILTVLLLAITIMTSTAQAGLLDWFIGSSAKADQASSGSFDQLYASAVTTPVSTGGALAMLDTSNALVAVASPAGKAATVLRKTYFVQVSGYNSEVAQCDDSPFITASGTHVHWGTIAANIIDANGRNIPFGTIVKIPSLFGDQIFIVEDRLNKRYTNNVDVWFEKHADAIKLGRRNVQIEVIR